MSTAVEVPTVPTEVHDYLEAAGLEVVARTRMERVLEELRDELVGMPEDARELFASTVAASVPLAMQLSSMRSDFAKAIGLARECVKSHPRRRRILKVLDRIEKLSR